MPKILVLDDSKAIADYISAILRGNGYECESLSHPTRLLSTLANNQYDLLLLDIYMPEIDGIKLLKQIRADARFHGLDIIIVSSITDEYIVAQCLMDGANDYIKKPINDVILSTRVHACLERQQLSKTRQALSQSSSNYQTMINNTRDGVMGFDGKGVITFSNDTLTKLFGYDRAWLVGKRVTTLMPEVFDRVKQDRGGEYRQQDMQRMMGIGREVIASKADASLFPIEFTVNQVQQGERLGFIGIVRDLSERRQHQKRILQFSRLMDSSLNEIYMFDSSTLTFIEVNKGGRDNLGYAMAELKTMTPLDIEPELTQELFEKKLSGLRSGTDNKIEFVTHHQRKDGSLYTVEVHLQLMPEEPPIFVAIILDISQRKKIEEQLECAQKQLFQSQKLESLGTLAGGIAHDFNNILAIIEGNTELALDDAQEGSEQSEHLHNILTASAKAVSLIKQILAFGRSEVAAFSAINLVDVIAEALHLVRPLIPANIEITQNIAASHPVIRGDKTQIHQIFTNIINNAVQAMEQGGGLISIAIEDDDEYVSMSIADTGSGIPLGDQANIFDPFFTSKALGKGTGLGLSVAHQLVEHHKGSISLKSSSTAGSHFVINIPKSAQPLAEVNANSREVLHGSGRILVVDDEAELRDLCQLILQSAGYRVVTEENAEAALRRFQRQPNDVDLVLTDYAMPGMSGGELATALLSIRPLLPIILLTGFTKKFSQEQAQEMGIRYLLKPLKRAALLAAVGEKLSAPKSLK